MFPSALHDPSFHRSIGQSEANISRNVAIYVAPLDHRISPVFISQFGWPALSDTFGIEFARIFNLLLKVCKAFAAFTGDLRSAVLHIRGSSEVRLEHWIIPTLRWI